MNDTPEDLLAELIAVARAAGTAILELYGQVIRVQRKSDASPVTAADSIAEALIFQGLERIAPHIPIISEEAAAAGRITEVAERFWLVDPLDGTKEFISRNGEFTVNLALIEHAIPVLGVVLAPALNRLFAGHVAQGAFLDDDTGRRAIRCRPVTAEGLTVVSSRSHGDATALDAFLAGRRVAASVSAGSSLKLCLIAAGEADLYPRLGRTMEWDIAAGHAVLSAAGGSIQTIAGGHPLVIRVPAYKTFAFLAEL